MESPIAISPRSRAMVIAEDLARCLHAAENLYDQLLAARDTLKNNAVQENGKDLASFRPGAIRTACLARYVGRVVDPEIKEMLQELDRVFGVSEEVSW